MLFVALLFGISVLAQKKNEFRVNLDLGYTISDKEGRGLIIYLEPMYNIQNNINVGLRLGLGALGKKKGTNEVREVAISQTRFNLSYMGTFDYHFNAKKSSFVPFVGAGIGHTLVANFRTESREGTNELFSTEEKTDRKLEGRFIGMLRGGFEWNKFRVSADLNLIQASELESLNGNEKTIKNTYVGVSLGFFFGGGKWKKI